MRKILIVDDHPIVLCVITAIARNVFRDACITTAEVLPEGLSGLLGQLDLALIDLGLPGFSGIEAFVRFRSIAPAVAAVVISANEEQSTLRAAFQAGARGYIPKTATPPVIASALRLVAAGSTYIPAQALSEPPPAESQRTALTDRQRDVLRLIAQGFANKEIARQLCIAEDTVKQHAKAVYAALGISSRSQAVRAADRFGIKVE